MEKVPTKFIRVEYDLDYTGGDYSRQGCYVFVPLDLIDTLKGDVEAAFEKHTGHNRCHIVHYTLDEEYDADGFWVRG